MPVSRNDRVSEEVRSAISQILMHELKDPGINAMVSVVRVDVTRDFRYAKTFVSLYGTPEQNKETLEALQRAAGFVRRELGKRVRLHYTPEVQFVVDHNIEYGAYMNAVFHKLQKENPAPAEEKETNPDA